jgi:DNA replication protein DnaC
MALVEDLNELRLHYTAANLDDVISQSRSAEHTSEQLLERIVELELAERSRRSTERRLREAKIGNYKPMDEFDWKWPQSIDRDAIEEALRCDFITKKGNIILAGAQGLGKSMIARNIAFQAVQRGFNSLIVTASQFVLNMGSQESKQALERRLRFYEKPDLLVLDEIGYMAFENKAADFIFEIVNRRYEKGSIIITTNLAFSEWNKVFPGAPCVTAMIDRLTHHARIFKIAGDSYRRKESMSKIGN